LSLVRHITAGFAWPKPCRAPLSQFGKPAEAVCNQLLLKPQFFQVSIDYTGHLSGASRSTKQQVFPGLQDPTEALLSAVARIDTLVLPSRQALSFPENSCRVPQQTVWSIGLVLGCCTYIYTSECRLYLVLSGLDRLYLPYALDAAYVTLLTNVSYIAVGLGLKENRDTLPLRWSSQDCAKTLDMFSRSAAALLREVQSLQPKEGASRIAAGDSATYGPSSPVSFPCD
jgi:hypothetical protein